MRFLIFLLFLSAVSYSQMPPIEPGVSLELAKWRAAHYSDVRYKLNLTLEKMSPVLKGTIEIRVNVGVATLLSPSTRSGEKVPIILDWRKIRGDEEKTTVSNVIVNGNAVDLSRLSPRGDKSVAAPFEEINEHLIFREGVVLGENVIKLDFTSPILTSGSAITRYVDKEDGSEYLYSLFVPSDASTAFPVFDQPDIKARFQLNVGVPANWKVVSNSAEEDVHPLRQGADGKIASEGFLFEETGPISTYLFAFAAGEFTEVIGERSPAQTGSRIDIQRDGLANRAVALSRNGASSTNIFVRKSQAAKFKPHADEVFRLNREAVKYFEEYFDYKFPFPKYDLVLIPEFPFGGMEHAGATFLRESSVIFPQEPTKNDLVNRATLIFHETAHQWFGDTVTMRWFDDLWLKEGFATFMGYKALEKIMPEMNAWKVFYERIKQGAYQTDSTKGTTPIYQEIKNLSAAKSAYGNIVYNKAPAFLRQAEFYLGEDKFQTAVRAFLKKHEFGNAGWEDLVKEFENARPPGASEVVVGDRTDDMASWARQWVKVPGLPIIRPAMLNGGGGCFSFGLVQTATNSTPGNWVMRAKPLARITGGGEWTDPYVLEPKGSGRGVCDRFPDGRFDFFFPNYHDYGYGIFLLDEKSRDYVLKNIQNEKDPFLRSMMWGALWDSVREGELEPRKYVELVVDVLIHNDAFPRPSSGTAKAVTDDESTVALLLSRVGTAMNYYIPRPASDDPERQPDDVKARKSRIPTVTGSNELSGSVETMLSSGMELSQTVGQRITYYRAFLNIAASENARFILKNMLKAGDKNNARIPLKTKDKFDIVTRLLILNDPEAPQLLADLEKTETGDDAKRYAYASKAAIATAGNKAKYWNDFTANKEISESWIEAAFGPWNSIRHSELTLPYLQKALQELPNHKRNRKIFFVNGWLGAFIGGQRSEDALAIVNKFLADNPNLDNDLRLKILENVDLIERAVRIRNRFH